MRICVRGAVCAAVIWLFCLHLAKAQPYRYLTVDDFKGTPRTKTTTVAETNCYIDLHYSVSNKSGKYILRFNVGLVMNRDLSWINFASMESPGMLSYILKHEQGHYDICYFEQQELIREFSRSSYDKNYQQQVTDIFDRVHAKYDQLEKDYDEDTVHSINGTQQLSWNRYFERTLMAMNVYASRN